MSGVKTSGCLETLCHVCGPLHNEMVILLCTDGDPRADPLPDQTMPPLVMTECDISGAILNPSIGLPSVSERSPLLHLANKYRGQRAAPA